MSQDKIKYNAKVHDYVACLYDGKWWVGLVLEVSFEEQDCRVSFMHPASPTNNICWPVRAYLCGVSFENIICKVSTPVTATGRTYHINEEDIQNITSTFK